jgi:trimethylamine:corrinoid methyltransferase-like protein
VIDRANQARWADEGRLTLGARARREIERLVAAWEPSRLDDHVKAQLERRMASAASRAGMDALPKRDA